MTRDLSGADYVYLWVTASTWASGWARARPRGGARAARRRAAAPPVGAAARARPRGARPGSAVARARRRAGPAPRAPQDRHVPGAPSRAGREGPGRIWNAEDKDTPARP